MAVPLVVLGALVGYAGLGGALDGEVPLDVARYNDGIAYVCTSDLGPTTSVVELPADIDPEAELTVVVSGDDRETRSVVVPAG